MTSTTDALLAWFGHAIATDASLKDWAGRNLTDAEIWNLAVAGIDVLAPTGQRPGSSAPPQPTLPPTTTPPAPTPTPTPPPATGGGGGKLIPFTAANWPRKYGSGGTASADGKQLRIDLTKTAACNPNNDGHYRCDWSNINTFKAGTVSFVSIPVQFPSGAPNPSSGSWWQIAEAKTPNNPGGWAEWGIYIVNSKFDFRMGRVSSTTANGTGHPSLWQGGSPADGWNTFVVESNYSTTKNGYLNLFLNGTKVWGCSGVIILAETATDLDLNSYTGGSPVPSTVVHGAPLIGASLASVQQAGGWRVSP